MPSPRGHRRITHFSPTVRERQKAVVGPWGQDGRTLVDLGPAQLPAFRDGPYADVASQIRDQSVAPGSEANPERFLSRRWVLAQYQPPLAVAVEDLGLRIAPRGDPLAVRAEVQGQGPPSCGFPEPDLGDPSQGRLLQRPEGQQASGRGVGQLEALHRISERARGVDRELAVAEDHELARLGSGARRLGLGSAAARTPRLSDRQART